MFSDFLRVARIRRVCIGRSGKYIFIYALDVIEHIGCHNFGTILEDDADDKRRGFLAACFSALKRDGSLLLTTSNRLCPLDIGHWHKYHAVGRLTPERQTFGLSLPWHQDNFLVSGSEMSELMKTSVGKEQFRMEYVRDRALPTLAGRRRC